MWDDEIRFVILEFGNEGRKETSYRIVWQIFIMMMATIKMIIMSILSVTTIMNIISEWGGGNGVEIKTERI